LVTGRRRGDHRLAMIGDEPLQDFPLDPPVVGVAVELEDLRQLVTRRLLHQPIELDERTGELLRQELPDRRLPCSAHAEQGDPSGGVFEPSRSSSQSAICS